MLLGGANSPHPGPTRRLAGNYRAVGRGRLIIEDEEPIVRQAARSIDAKGAPVHPGFVESHMHASFQLFRGALPDQLRETDAFDTFESVFFNAVTDEEEYLAVLLSSMEMIRNGNK